MNIGHSCNLLQPDSRTVTISNMTSREQFAEALQAEHAKLVGAHANATNTTTTTTTSAHTQAAAGNGNSNSNSTQAQAQAQAYGGLPAATSTAAAASTNNGRTGGTYSRVFCHSSQVRCSLNCSPYHICILATLAVDGIATRMRRSVSNLAASVSAAASAQAEAEAVRNTVLILDGPSFSYFDASSPLQCSQLLEIGRLCRSVIGKSTALYPLLLTPPQRCMLYQITIPLAPVVTTM